MSVTFHVDEQATGFDIIEDMGGKEVGVCFSSRYDPDIEITLYISPEMFRKSSKRWRMTMNEELTLAYDLKHQLEVMPVEHKDNYMVDGFETQLSAYDRVLLLIAYLERMNNGRR